MQHGNGHGSDMKKTRDKARETALDILNRLDNSTANPRYDYRFRFQLRSTVKTGQGLYLQSGIWRSQMAWSLGLDFVKHFSHTKPEKIDPKIFNILRLGLFQMMYLTRVPISAAVNTSVELAKTVADIRTVNYVNALLRKASVEYEDVDFPDFQRDPVAFIAASHAFPEWLVQRWVNRFGPHETRNLCEAFNIIPPITVRTNRLKTDRDSLIRLLRDEAVDVQATPHSPDGVSFYHPKLPVAKPDRIPQGLVSSTGRSRTACLLFFGSATR